MRTRWLIAIDDTDNLDSIGTGRLARRLAAHLEREGRVIETTVTRHQLLVHPDIPYTSHNSSACIGGLGHADSGDELLALARTFLLEHPQAGANPGLCVAPADAVPAPLVELGRRAQQLVLDLAAFDREVAPHGLRIWSGGDTGQGRIGAVCAVALRSTGEDGRFIDLPGIRSVGGRMRVAEVLGRTGVVRVATVDGESLGPDEEVETRDWIRPALRGGDAVFLVRREDQDYVPAQPHGGDDG